jgi:hypothetical protein
MYLITNASHQTARILPFVANRFVHRSATRLETCYNRISIENRKSAHETVRRRPEVLVIDPTFARIHFYERIPYDILEEWTNVDLA